MIISMKTPQNVIVHLNIIIEGEGALINPEGLTQVIPMRTTSNETRVFGRDRDEKDSFLEGGEVK